MSVNAAILAWLLGMVPVLAGSLTDYGPIATGAEHGQRPGAIVWMDLLTRDVNEAARFYRDVFGWEIETAAGGEYAYATLDGRPVASIVAYETELGDAEGLWIPSLSVRNADQAVEAVVAAGGAILEPPEDLAGRGRYTLVEDPTGAVVMLLRASNGDPIHEERINGWYWNELWTDDTVAASKFYGEVIGYRTVLVRDLDGNRYEVMGRDQQPYAGMMESPLPQVEPTWLAYVLVEDVNAAAKAVLNAGGAVLVPPLTDGFNEDVAIIADSTGGVLALQQKKEAK